jgi:hypothetical protein
MRIGAVILTKTADKSFFDMTAHCISTLEEACENANVPCHIVVLESNTEANDLGFVYTGGTAKVETIVPDETFNFNRFYNIGMSRLQDSELLLFLNNDLVFNESSIQRTIDFFTKYPELMSATPLDPEYSTHKKYLGNLDPIWGYKVKNQVCGWAIFARREVFDKIGQWDEQFIFWYQDNDYSSTIEAAGLKHALLPTVFVFHLESKSHKVIPRGKSKDFKDNMKQVYLNKWKQQQSQSSELIAKLF